MTLSPLAPPARRGEPTLTQYIVTCPQCAGVAAAHLDGKVTEPGEPTLIRFVCPRRCPIDPGDVLASIPDTLARVSA